MPKFRPVPQKTIGVLGGMSNQATSEYYRLLNERLNRRLGGWDNGEIVVVSVNFGNIEHFVRTDDWDGASAYLSAKLDALERAGADIVVCVSNTMHRVVAPLMQGRCPRFIHIADPAGQAVTKAGIRRVGLLGTLPVMRQPYTRDYLRDRHGLEVLVPSEADMALVDRIIFDELVRRELRPESKAAYLRIIDDLRAAGADGVILGCTEIFLLLQQEDRPDFPMFDTTSLHVDAAVAAALE